MKYQMSKINDLEKELKEYISRLRPQVDFQNNRLLVVDKEGQVLYDKTIRTGTVSRRISNYKFL